MISIPEEVKSIINSLQKAGHEAYIVGGSLRDLLRGEKPKDWDVTTSAKPEEIMKIFSRRPISEKDKEVGTPTDSVGAGHDAFYENKFLTVTVKIGSEDETLKEIEVTTFRAEGKYTDKRHPDEVHFAKTLEEDLSRRDFTINAIALELPISNSQPPKLIDPFNGQNDLKNKIVRAVGDPKIRFEEDALRMMRAVRFSIQLEFEIEGKTKEAVKKLVGNLEFIAKERIRDELIKIFETPRAKDGIELMRELGLLKYIIPELEEGIGVENRPKIFTIWEHNLKALEYGAKQNFPLDVKIAALLHDAGKPAAKGPMKNNEWTFYGHDLIGAKMAARILERLHFPKATVEKIATLIRWHLFKYDPDEGITDSSVRRLIRRVGAQNMDDLVRLRICDRMGMGVPKALPYRLRHFQFRVEKILREEETPTPKMLKVNGDDIMKILGISPGIKIGHILEVLLQEVIDDPEKNKKEYLQKRVQELGKLSDEELIKMAESSEQKVELMEDERVGEMKAKYYVK